MIDSDQWSTPRRSAGSRRRHRRRWPIVAVLAVVALVVAYVAVAATRSARFDPAQAERTLRVSGPALHLRWPAYGQSAIALGNGPVLASHGRQHPAPTASTAKLITVLVVLGRRPLSGNADGPTITLTAADVAIYQRYVNVDGSVVPVSVGQRITERDALEAILLPSANNLADSLAIWAFGSMSAYRTAATAYLNRIGLTHTRIGSDASGFAPSSVSTADDLVRIGQLAMADPVVRAIVAMPSAQVPGDGVVHNVNTLVGDDGIVGIKTGNSDQNGGVFVGAARRTVAGHTITVVTAVSGAQSLDAALTDSRNLLLSATHALAVRTVVDKDAPVGTFSTPGGTVTAVSAAEVQAVVFGPQPVPVTVRLEPVGPGPAGRVVGSLAVPASAAVGAQHVPVVLRDAVHDPSLLHKITHP